MPELVVEPVADVGPGMLVPTGVHPTSHGLSIGLRKGPTAKVGQRRLDTGLAVPVVHLAKEAHPLLSVGQLAHGRRLEHNQRVNHRRMADENLQGDDGAGAGAEDDRRVRAQVLDQAADIVGIGLEPAVIVLRPVESAPGEAASVVDSHGVAGNQVFANQLEGVARAAGAGTMTISGPLPTVS